MEQLSSSSDRVHLGSFPFARRLTPGNDNNNKMTSTTTKRSNSRYPLRQPLQQLQSTTQTVSECRKRRQTTAGENFCKRRRSERLIKKQQQLEQATVCHFDFLPDEILLRIFEFLDDKSRVEMKITCPRFHDLILAHTVKLDHKCIQLDRTVSNPISAYDLILSCPRLKCLSLIENPKNNITQPFLNGPLIYCQTRVVIAKQLALRCINIRIVDVASIQALRLIKDYVRFLGGSSRLTELRVYSSEVRSLVKVMLEIVRYSPNLTVFKLLRRTCQKRVASSIDEFLYNQLWTLLGRQLISFSTNVSDRLVLANCCSKMVNLQRIVIWHLDEHEVFTLATNCKQLKVVILMNCSLYGFKHLVHFQNMVDLTFHIHPHFLGVDYYLCKDFEKTFAVIGMKLIHLSLVMKNTVIRNLLSSMPRYCLNLQELKLKEINQSDYPMIIEIIPALPSLTCLHWTDCVTLHDPHDVGLELARKLFSKSPRLEKIFTLHQQEVIFYSPGRQKSDLSSGDSTEEKNESEDSEDFT